ncbi:hypothetical protein GBA52_024954, partial [Prunus armeniaca]
MFPCFSSTYSIKIKSILPQWNTVARSKEIPEIAADFELFSVAVAVATYWEANPPKSPFIGPPVTENRSWRFFTATEAFPARFRKIRPPSTPDPGAGNLYRLRSLWYLQSNNELLESKIRAV